MNIPAVYEHGIFRPTVPVHLPEGTKVSIPTPNVATPPQDDSKDEGMDEVYAILSERYSSGYTDTAARHNEHQP